MTVVKLILIILLLIGGLYRIHLCMRDSEILDFVMGIFMWIFSFLIILDTWFY